VDQEGDVYSLANTNVSIVKSGYLFVYVSNVSNTLEVYFDNLAVRHYTGPLLEETHYYPFGLTMHGISSKASGKLENKKKYNGIELNNDFDLNIYDAFYRNLDVQTGRWWETDPKTENQEHMSPYTSMGNDPVRYSDFLGDKQEEFGGSGPGDALVLGVAELLGGAATTAGAGTVLLAASAVAPVALVIYHPEALLTGASAAQMDLRVEMQTRTPAKPAAPLKSLAGGIKDVAAKAVPNPNGKKGSEAHQAGVNKAEKELKESGYTQTQREVEVKTPKGEKGKRYVDVRGTNSKGETKDIQVGKQNKNGTPVKRERKAMDDIEESYGQRPDFLPYN